MQHLETQSEPGLGHVHEMTGISHYTGHGHDAALTSAGIGKYVPRGRSRSPEPEVHAYDPCMAYTMESKSMGGLAPKLQGAEV